MVRRYVIAFAVAAAAFNSSATGATADGSYGAAPPDIKERLDRLAKAYPDWISGYDETFLILKTGAKFPISDRRTNKSFDELLEQPDIDDMFYAPYPAGTPPQPPAQNVDPGRVRFEPLFVAMYGDCHRNEVVRKLRAIDWLPRHGGGRVTITTVNGVDKALEAVSRDLDGLPDGLIKYVKPTDGTYNCRTVSGSRVRSMHAYGASIDINVTYANYWRWDAKPIWRNRIPAEIVGIFEKHGFIWGGYWYHYDTMHFEYRPELLPAAASATSK